jgi:hypothetical protein
MLRGASRVRLIVALLCLWGAVKGFPSFPGQDFVGQLWALTGFRGWFSLFLLWLALSALLRQLRVRFSYLLEIPADMRRRKLIKMGAALFIISLALAAAVFLLPLWSVPMILLFAAREGRMWFLRRRQAVSFGETEKGSS